MPRSDVEPAESSLPKVVETLKKPRTVEKEVTQEPLRTYPGLPPLPKDFGSIRFGDISKFKEVPGEPKFPKVAHTADAPKRSSHNHRRSADELWKRNEKYLDEQKRRMKVEMDTYYNLMILRLERAISKAIQNIASESHAFKATAEIVVGDITSVVIKNFQSTRKSCPARKSEEVTNCTMSGTIGSVQVLPMAYPSKPNEQFQISTTQSIGSMIVEPLIKVQASVLQHTEIRANVDPKTVVAKKVPPKPAKFVAKDTLFQVLSTPTKPKIDWGDM